MTGILSILNPAKCNGANKMYPLSSCKVGQISYQGEPRLER